MATLTEDARKAAAWIGTALTSSGYQADFSLESLREIDRFLMSTAKMGTLFQMVSFRNSSALAYSLLDQTSARSSFAHTMANGEPTTRIRKVR